MNGQATGHPIQVTSFILRRRDTTVIYRIFCEFGVTTDQPFVLSSQQISRAVFSWLVVVWVRCMLMCMYMCKCRYSCMVQMRMQVWMSMWMLMYSVQKRDFSNCLPSTCTFTWQVTFLRLICLSSLLIHLFLYPFLCAQRNGKERRKR